MINRNRTIVLLQSVIVLLMSAAASFSLYPHIGVYVVAVFGGMIALGAATLVFPQIGVLPFSLVSIGVSLAAIISHSTVDIGLQTFSGGINNPNKIWGYSEPLFSFSVILTIGLFLVVGYLALTLLSSLAREYRDMKSGNAKNLKSGGVLLGTATGISVAVVIILKLVQPPITKYLEGFSWSVPVFLPLAILIVGGFMYWLVTGKRRQEHS